MTNSKKMVHSLQQTKLLTIFCVNSFHGLVVPNTYSYASFIKMNILKSRRGKEVSHKDKWINVMQLKLGKPCNLYINVKCTTYS